MMKEREASTGISLVSLSGVQVWNQVVNLSKTMVLARVFSLYEYSAYAKIILILDFAFAVIVLNLPSAANYFMAKAVTDSERRYFLQTYYLLCTLVGVFMGLALALLAPTLGKILQNPDIQRLWWYLAATPIMQIMTKATTYVLVANGESQKSIRISFLSSLFLIISLLIISISSTDLSTCLLLFLGVEGVGMGIGYRIAFRLTRSPNKESVKDRFFDAKMVVNIYKYIVPVGLSSIIIALNSTVNRFLVSVTSDDVMYAVFANASKELPVTVISVAVAAVVIPKLVSFLRNGESSKAIAVWINTHAIVSCVSFLLLFGTMTFASEVFVSIYSDKYISGLSIFRIYLLLIPFHCISYSLFLSAFGKTTFILQSAVVSFLVNIGFAVIGYFAVGLQGLAIATVVSALAMVSVQLVKSARLLEVPILKLISVADMLRFLLANMLLAPAAKLLQTYWSGEKYVGEVGEAVLIGVLWSLIYICIFRKRLKHLWKGLNIK